MKNRQIMYRLASKLTVPPVTVKDERMKRHSIVINHLGLAVPIITGKVSFRPKKTTEYSYFPRNQRQLTDESYREYLKEMMEGLVTEVANWP
jgi:hypothetical protein